MKKIIFVTCILVSFIAWKQSEQPVYQLSTIGTLLAGNYDGSRTVGSLRQYGDFGIGTFDKLDGEMILYKGDIFKAKSDGTVRIAKENETTPYASVCLFHPTIEFSIQSDGGMAELDSMIKQHIPNQRDIYAIEITGLFDSMIVRSVSKQKKPYQPMISIVKNQATFQHANISGTILGFYAPNNLKNIMVKGLHVHFLSEDVKKGGHVLSFKTSNKLLCRIAEYSEMQLDLYQKQKSSQNNNENKDLQTEIEKVEK